MKITHIVPSLEARHGGPSRTVLGLCLGLRDAGHEVELLTSAPVTETSTETLGTMNVTTFPRVWPRRFCRVPDMARHLRELSLEVVHHHALWLRTLHYAHQHARRHGLPLVISPRGMMSTWAWNHHRGRKAFARRFVHPQAFENAAGWHATSEGEAAEIRALGFNQPICVAPNGVEAPTSRQLEIAREFWRERLGAHADRPVALFYSRFHAKKRVIEMIDLWLRTAPADWLLLLVGIPDQFSVRQLSDYALRELGRQRILVFDGTRMPPPYAIARLMVLPSHSENFGMVVAEAMAAGVPALVTDTTPWAEINTRGAGWCVPFEAFESTLQQALAESPESLARRGEVGRAWTAATFTWDRIAQRLAGFYRQLHRTG